MPNHLDFTLHASLFPEQVNSWVARALRERRVNPLLHYLTYKQARHWLALHAAHAPGRRDPDCARIYHDAFDDTARALTPGEVAVIGLGTGGGHKEAELVRALETGGHRAAFVPVDASLPLVADAWRTVEVARKFPCPLTRSRGAKGLVCDLANSGDLADVLDSMCPAEMPRVLTCFGVLPNVGPESLLPQVTDALRPGDHLLIGANLAPGPKIRPGLERVLPQYQNPETDRWLMLFLSDLGIEPHDGTIQWRIADDPAGVAPGRFEAWYEFRGGRSIDVDGESLRFDPGESLLLFYSWRHTPDSLEFILSRHGLESVRRWVASSGEEAAVRCVKPAAC